MTTAQQGRSAPKLPTWLDKHITIIMDYQKKLEETPDDLLMERMELLSEMNTFVGRVSAFMAEYHRKYRTYRKYVYHITYKSSPAPKASNAELTVTDIRDHEDEAYGDYKRWDHAFQSNQEKINVLKKKLGLP